MRICRAKCKNLDKFVTGYYAKLSSTTYCFTEDYLNHPITYRHFIICDEMTDWGLPNELKLYEIDPDTLVYATDFCDEFGNVVFENDLVKVTFQCEDGNIENIFKVVWGLHSWCFQDIETKEICPVSNYYNILKIEVIVDEERV